MCLHKRFLRGEKCTATDNSFRRWVAPSHLTKGPTDRPTAGTVVVVVVQWWPMGDAAVAVETIQSMLPLLPLGLVCVRACVCCWFRGERKKKKRTDIFITHQFGWDDDVWGGGSGNGKNKKEREGEWHGNSNQTRASIRQRMAWINVSPSLLSSFTCFICFFGRKQKERIGIL